MVAAVLVPLAVAVSSSGQLVKNPSGGGAKKPYARLFQPPQSAVPDTQRREGMQTARDPKLVSRIKVLKGDASITRRGPATTTCAPA